MIFCNLPQPNPSLIDEPSRGPKERCNTQAALEVILLTVAADGEEGLMDEAEQLE